jgi:hypothetical protein
VLSISFPNSCKNQEVYDVHEKKFMNFCEQSNERMHTIDRYYRYGYLEVDEKTYALPSL